MGRGVRMFFKETTAHKRIKHNRQYGLLRFRKNFCAAKLEYTR